jgi:hypothetical protein
MKQIAWLFLVALGSVTVGYAQSSTNSMELSGTVCHSTCVSQVNYVATCDKTCADNSGDAVLVDDQGNIMKIANQNICKSHMGKHVKVEAVRTEKEREKTLQEQQQYLQVLKIQDYGG